MIKADKQENTDLIVESIDYLEKKGFKNIKADHEDYETPKSFVKKKNNVVITPDIVAEKAGRKFYFELGLKSEKPTLLKTKWRLLDVISRMRDHRFKIITKRGHYKFTNDILSDLNLEKDLIKL